MASIIGIANGAGKVNFSNEIFDSQNLNIFFQNASSLVGQNVYVTIGVAIVVAGIALGVFSEKLLHGDPKGSKHLIGFIPGMALFGAFRSPAACIAFYWLHMTGWLIGSYCYEKFKSNPVIRVQDNPQQGEEQLRNSFVKMKEKYLQNPLMHRKEAIEFFERFSFPRLPVQKIFLEVFPGDYSSLDISLKFSCWEKNCSLPQVAKMLADTSISDEQIYSIDFAINFWSNVVDIWGGIPDFLERKLNTSVPLCSRLDDRKVANIWAFCLHFRGVGPAEYENVMRQHRESFENDQLYSEQIRPYVSNGCPSLHQAFKYLHDHRNEKHPMSEAFSKVFSEWDVPDWHQYETHAELMRDLDRISTVEPASRSYTEFENISRWMQGQDCFQWKSIGSVLRLQRERYLISDLWLKKLAIVERLPSAFLQIELREVNKGSTEELKAYLRKYNLMTLSYSESVTWLSQHYQEVSLGIVRELERREMVGGSYIAPLMDVLAYFIALWQKNMKSLEALPMVFLQRGLTEINRYISNHLERNIEKPLEVEQEIAQAILIELEKRNSTQLPEISLETPADWYSVTRVSKKLFSLPRSIVSLIQEWIPKLT